MSLAEKVEMPTEPASAARGALLDGRYRVDLSRPVDFLQQGSSLAVETVDIQDPTSELFAVIAGPYSFYRKSVAEALRGSRHGGMLDLLAEGIVRFSPLDIRAALVFERPRGGLVYQDGQGPVPESVILEKILPAIAASLLDLHREGVTHRAIRASNLFYTDIDRQHVVLGEAISQAPGMLQPTVYEPLESMMAHPAGRGDGLPAHDLYAVGILFVHLLGGALPGAGMSDEELYRGKLARGSYALLVEKMRLSPRMYDVLAGLLHDDPSRRWTAETLANWRETIKETPRRGGGDPRTTDKILFEDKEYNSPRVLARNMIRKPKAATAFLKTGRLAKWVKNSLRDEVRAEEIAELYSEGAGVGRSRTRDEATITAQAARLLDPKAPLWYRNVSFARNAIGPLLLDAYRDDSIELKKSIAELFGNGLLLSMAVSEFRENRARRTDWLPEGVITGCQDFMKISGDLGYGLERCLYELCPDTPCLSTLVLGSHVRNIAEFIEIAEKKLQASNGHGNPFDRHAAAFIATKSRGLDKYMKLLSLYSVGSVEHTLIQLRLFAALQALSHPGPLPGFAAWAEELLKPVFLKIRSRLRRDLVLQRFREARKSGDLTTILETTDLERQLQLDSREYQAAIAAVSEADRMVIYLMNGTEMRRALAERYGAWITSVLSVTALLTSAAFSALYFLG